LSTIGNDFSPKARFSKLKKAYNKNIFLKKKYDGTNSKRFIKIPPYPVLARAGERRGLPSTL